MGDFIELTSQRVGDEMSASVTEKCADRTPEMLAGVPASMNQGLRPGTWPDFMGKGPHRSYQCDNILGQLYRIVSPNGIFEIASMLRSKTTCQIDQDPRFNPASEQDIAQGVDARLCRLVIPTAFLNHAAEMKRHYDLLLWDVLLR